jgi:hypothetical protein
VNSVSCYRDQLKDQKGEPFFFAAASIKSSRPTFAILDWVSRLTADSWKVSFSSEPKIRLTLAPTMLMVG